MDIKTILNQALNKRCIFHSEADFQHHFAWEIHKHLGDSQIRLEYPLFQISSKRWEYCDIFLCLPQKIGIELKYKTKVFSKIVQGERFELKQQGAQDIGRYDFLKDISRLENWIRAKKIDKGLAILLTNDQTYWIHPKNINTVDKAFRIHSRQVEGSLSWDKLASKGTTKGREKPIELCGSYSLEWSKTPKDEFRYLLVEVGELKAHTVGDRPH